jgi:hypothetical protein
VRNAYETVVRKAEGKIPLRRPVIRWENNIKMDLIGIEWKVVNWVHLAQERDQWRVVVNMVIKFWVP